MKISKIPVLIITHDRPIETKKLIDSLKCIKPNKIFFFNDKYKNIKNKKLVLETRNLINSINWKCDKNTYFTKKNLGCRLGVETAIDWFFQNNDFGIILEDDCIPNKSFFEFTGQLLDKYNNDSRISTITGFNGGFKLKNYVFDYYFSIYGSSWGWATWANRWKEYRNINIREFIKNKDIQLNLIKKGVNKTFIKNVQRTIDRKIDSWAYLWTYHNIAQNKLSIMPRVNLIKNIGFNKNATHTKFAMGLSLKQGAMPYLLKHPITITSNYFLDKNKSLEHSKYYQLLKFIKFKLTNIFYKN